MKVWIEEDEWWPVRSFVREGERSEASLEYADGPFEVDDALYERWKAVLAEFYAVQDIVSEIQT